MKKTTKTPPPPATLQVLYREDYVTIYYNTEDEWIYADWTGFLTNESIKTGSELLLKAIKTTHSKKLINDNTNLTGIKANAITWLATEFGPRLQEGGLQYLSWIYKNNSVSESSADLVLGLSKTDIITIVFDNVPMAEKWMRSLL